MPTESDNQASSPTSPNDQKNGSKHTTISHDPTAYVARARVTRPEPPKPSYNPMQFVQIKPCNLFKSAQEQLKRAEEVKKVKEIKKEEPEEWQNNLDNWKSSRRKRVEHIIDRVVEVKKLELEEHDRTRRKSATFSEMLEKRGERRGVNKLASLSVYNEDESNDLSDLGIGANSASGKSSISEDFDNHSAMVNNDKEDTNENPENNINNNGKSSNCNTNNINDLVINEGENETNNRDTCEYTYESAIQDYKTRVSRASSNGLFNNNNMHSPTDNNSPAASYNQIKRSSKIEEKLSSFEIKIKNEDSQTVSKTDLPKVDISKRKELFEGQPASQASSSNSQKRLSGEFSGTKSIKERLSNLENKSSFDAEDNKSIGDLRVICESSQNNETSDQIKKASSVSDVPVPSLRDRLSSLQSAVTKEEIKKPVVLIDEQQVALMRKEDEDLLNKQKLETLDESFSSSQELLNTDTDREDSGIHTTDVSCSVSQTDEQPEISHINEDTLQESSSQSETTANLELSVSVPTSSTTTSSSPTEEQTSLSPESQGDSKVDLVLRVDKDNCKSNASSISPINKLTARESLKGSRLKALLFENSDPLTQINELKTPEMGRMVYDNVLDFIEQDSRPAKKCNEIVSPPAPKIQITPNKHDLDTKRSSGIPSNIEDNSKGLVLLNKDNSKLIGKDIYKKSNIPSIKVSISGNDIGGKSKTLPRVPMLDVSKVDDIKKEIENGRVEKIISPELNENIEYSELPSVSKRIEIFHSKAIESEIPPSPPPPRRLRNKPPPHKGILVNKSEDLKIASQTNEDSSKKTIRTNLTGGTEVFNSKKCQIISKGTDHLPRKRITPKRRRSLDITESATILDELIIDCNSKNVKSINSSPSPIIEEMPCQKININKFPDPEHIFATPVIDISEEIIKKCDEFLNKEMNANIIAENHKAETCSLAPTEEALCNKADVNKIHDTNHVAPTSFIEVTQEDINDSDGKRLSKSKPSKIPISSFLYGPQGARRSPSSPIGSPISQKKLDILNSPISQKKLDSLNSPLGSPNSKRKSENVLIGKLQSVETKLKVTPSDGEFLPQSPSPPLNPPTTQSSPKINHKTHPQNGKPRNIFEFIRRNLYSSSASNSINNEGEDCGAVSINNSTFYVPIELNPKNNPSNKVNVEITKTIKTEKIIEHSENSEDEERNNEICDEINQMLDAEIAKLNEMEQNL